MNRTVVMILGGAVLVAVIVAMLVQAKLSPKSDSADGGPKVEILVAARKLQTGERLSAETVAWKAVPQDAAYAGSITKSSEPDLKTLSVYDSPLRRPVEAGEPITRQALISDIKVGGNYLAARLEPGMRAVSLAVKPQTGVSGMLVPGDRVDAIVAYAPRIVGEGRALSEFLVSRNAAQTVISNRRVLAIDQSSSEDATEAKVAKTVTIEVTKEEAEILALAVKMGEVTLAMRRLGEKDAPGAGITPITTDMTTSEVMRKINQALRKSKTVSNSVRVYSGSAVQNVPVRSAGEAQPKTGME